MTDEDNRRFWQTKKLEQMDAQEWESLCDGCGRCCLQKVHYVDTNEIYFTKVACKLLNCRTGRCRDYPNRKEKVPDCIQLQAKEVANYRFLPRTCAYRLLAEGKPLYSWHPLISGVPINEVGNGVSVSGFAINEADDIDPENYLIEPPVPAE